jgi:hypothetical protein
MAARKPTAETRTPKRQPPPNAPGNMEIERPVVATAPPPNAPTIIGLGIDPLAERDRIAAEAAAAEG